MATVRRRIAHTEAYTSLSRRHASSPKGTGLLPPVRYPLGSNHRKSSRRSKRGLIQGKILQEDQHGWKVVHIYGDAYDRGYAHGHLLRGELRYVVAKLHFLITVILDMSYDAYMKYCQKHIAPIVQYEYTEIYEELRGIRDGSRDAITMLELIAWNAWLSMYNVDMPPPPKKSRKHRRTVSNRTKSTVSEASSPLGSNQRCSAFVATGNATRPGSGIVMAHNTHSDMASATLFNIVMYVDPTSGSTEGLTKGSTEGLTKGSNEGLTKGSTEGLTKGSTEGLTEGHAFVMQTCAGYVASGADWFITKAGIVGCETTISDTNYKVHFSRRNRHPYFCRIRGAMQYATTLDECANWMQKHNAGDYPGSWLFGDINTDEIMLCEIGLNHNNIQRTMNGVFYGMNSAHDFALRNQDTDDLTYIDQNTSSGARNIRLDALLNHKYYGKIDIEVAKRVLADHYDVQVERDRHPSSRTICNHYFMDPTTDSPNYPHSSIDGKVVDSRMAKAMTFSGRWGSSCGMAFSVKDHLHAYPEYRSWKKYLVDLPSQPWTTIKSPPKPTHTDSY